MNDMTTISAARMNSTEPAIRLVGVTKIFGRDPDVGWRMLQSGRPKSEIQAETGLVVGLDRVSLDIAPGQIYVVMGLSGSSSPPRVRFASAARMFWA
jgi:glycine betaine/proline transport system ATP-binding protein